MVRQPLGMFMAFTMVFAGEEVIGAPRGLQNFQTSSTLRENIWSAVSYPVHGSGSKAMDHSRRLQAGMDSSDRVLAPGVFCSDPANSGKVCNSVEGCGCLSGVGCVNYVLDTIGDGPSECEEDLTGGPAYNSPPCTSSSSEGDACSSSVEDVASGCATPGLTGVCVVGPHGLDAALECVTFDPNVESQVCTSDTSLCNARAETCRCTAGVCADTDGLDSSMDSSDSRPASGTFCSDPANFGQVCNVVEGCGCFTGLGCIHQRAILRLGGPLQCEEDLAGASGPVFDAPPCTSSSSEGDACSPSVADIASGCAKRGLAGVCTADALGPSSTLECVTFRPEVESQTCVSDTYRCASGSENCECSSYGLCFDPDASGSGCATTAASSGTPDCGDDVICDDQHMAGLRGQRINLFGVDGGWYSLIKDINADIHINVRLTAPLPDEFPNRQLVTGVSIMSGGHSLAIEVKNPYTMDTDGCPFGLSPCLANGGLRAMVDGYDVNELLRFSRQTRVAGGALSVSASNLPVECRQGKSNVMVESESLEDWILSFHEMAAPERCTRYIAENDLADLQSDHAIFKIETPTATVRLNAGVNHQDGGELDWDGRILPDLEFWQMDVAVDGLDIDSPLLTGILGETARPVYDEETGSAVMDGFEAFRGDVEDYRVAGPLDTSFPLLDETEGLSVMERIAISCAVLCSAIFLSTRVRSRKLRIDGTDDQVLGDGRRV